MMGVQLRNAASRRDWAFISAIIVILLAMAWSDLAGGWMGWPVCDPLDG